MKTPEEFWKLVDKKDGNDACWIWKGGTDGGGYGSVNWDGITTSAHRISYAIQNDINPRMMQANLRIRRTCENKLCVRHTAAKEVNSKEVKMAGKKKSKVPLVVVDQEDRLESLVTELSSEAKRGNKDRRNALILCASARAAIDDALLKLTQIRDAAEKIAEQFLPIYRDPDFVRFAEEGKALKEEGEREK